MWHKKLQFVVCMDQTYARRSMAQQHAKLLDFAVLMNATCALLQVLQRQSQDKYSLEKQIELSSNSVL
jgi:hypothetical protein